MLQEHEDRLQQRYIKLELTADETAKVTACLTLFHEPVLAAKILCITMTQLAGEDDGR